MGTREEEELIPALANGSVIPMTLSEAMARQAGLPSPDRVGWYPRPGTEAGYSPSEIPPGMINLDARSVHNHQNLFVTNDTGVPGRILEAEADRRHDAIMMKQEEQSAAVLRETESRAENYHYNEMNVAAQNFANLQAVTQQLRQELLNQTRELQENKLRFARHENQVAEERESIHREFRKNKEESLDFLRDLFARELNSRDRKANEEVARVREGYEDEIRGLKEQVSVLREKLEEEKARSSRSHLSTPRSNVHRFGPEPPPGFEPKAPPQMPTAPEYPWNDDPKTVPTSFRGLFSHLGEERTKTTADATGDRLPGSATEAALASLLGNPKVLEALTSKHNEPERPKVKEAESIKLPDFPSPETYRSWKISMRETVRAASDQPDEAFKWLLEVYTKESTLESLRDTGKFLTLDTKLLAALSKIVKGELGRRILNHKEVEASKGHAVRGRQVLLMFEQFFKTNEEAGSLYSVEDLLKVTLNSDDLSTFIHNWESVIAGMSHVPEETTLRDILLRQLRKSSKFKYDLEISDRAKEGTYNHTYQFLTQSIHDLLTRERIRRNRDKIARSHGDKYGTPAPDDTPTQDPFKGKGKGKDSKGAGKGGKVCFDWLKGKCNRGDKCKYPHRSASQNSKGSKHSSRASSRASSSRGSSRGRPPSVEKKKKICRFFKKNGKCSKGDKCEFLHKTRSKSPSITAPAKEGEKPRSPSPHAGRRRKTSRGRSREKTSNAACCLLQTAALSGTPERGGFAAAASSDRRTSSPFLARTHHTQYRAPQKSVRFNTDPVVYDVKCKVINKSSAPKARIFQSQFRTAKDCPKSSSEDLDYAIQTALELESIVKVFCSGATAECEFECVGPDGIGSCAHCHPLMACAAKVSELEFLADTGSEEDLLSNTDKRRYYPRSEPTSADNPVNLITANGPTSADKVARVTVPELNSKVEFYLLNSTPPVVSVGKRCLDEGFGFYWPPYRKPFFVKPDGTKLQCRLRGRVPIIGGEFSGYAFPAKSKVNSGAQALPKAPSDARVDDDGADLDEWLEELGREGIEVAPDGDEGFTQ